MTATLSEIRKVTGSEVLPDGCYEGQWSGCRVQFAVDNQQYIAQAAAGVRGLKIKCYVVVRGGQTTVTLEKPE
jgi:hypothetical protein